MALEPLGKILLNMTLLNPARENQGENANAPRADLENANPKP